MRTILVTAAMVGLIAAGASRPAHAIGCISGGAMGAIAGHQVHHGVVGAVGGCVAGHYAHKHAKQAAAQHDKNAAMPTPTTTTPAAATTTTPETSTPK